MKTRFLLSFIAIATSLLLSAVDTKAQAVNVQDSSALVDLYKHSRGSLWTNHDNWLHGPVFSWYGVTVTGARVTELNLTNNNLYGSVQPSLGNLTGLEKLDLSYNLLANGIPASIGNLTNLTYLNLLDNFIFGTLPSTIGHLTKLQYLNIESNFFGGSIPSALGKLTELTFLNMSYNEFTDTIPASLTKLVKLQTLDLSYNFFTEGHIPDSIGNLVNLTSLVLFASELTGPIPSSLYKLVNLTDLELDRNNLSGTLSHSILNFTRLKKLILAYNKFSGNFPFAIAGFDSLTTLHIQNNQFTYQGNRVTLNQPTHLTDLAMENNKFTFDGLESVARNVSGATYSPQALIPVHRHGSVLAVSAGGTLSNNTYHWQKLGETGRSVFSGDSTFQPTESGQYYAGVTNKIVKELTLYTDTVAYTLPTPFAKNNALAVSVSPNPATDKLTLRGLNELSRVKIIIADMSGYVWVNVLSQNQTSVACDVSRLKPGNYLLTVMDGTGMQTLSFIKK